MAAVSDDDNAVPTRIPTLTQGPEHLPSAHREGSREHISGLAQGTPVGIGIGKDEDQPIHAAVLPLPKARARLRLDIANTCPHIEADPATGLSRAGVERAQITGTNRHLDLPAPGRPDVSLEALQHLQLPGVANGRPAGYRFMRSARPTTAAWRTRNWTVTLRTRPRSTRLIVAADPPRAAATAAWLKPAWRRARRTSFPISMRWLMASRFACVTTRTVAGMPLTIRYGAVPGAYPTLTSTPGGRGGCPGSGLHRLEAPREEGAPRPVNGASAVGNVGGRPWAACSFGRCRHPVQIERGAALRTKREARHAAGPHRSGLGSRPAGEPDPGAEASPRRRP
jgi:hypothetical protein